jgi:uncharacterized membrane protein YkvA (DUF1232 family)
MDASRHENVLNDAASSVRPEDEDVIVERTEARLNSVKPRRATWFLLHNVGILLRMLRDRSFQMEWSSRALILGALVYFILPSDLVPDILPIMGLADDTLIVGMVIKRLAHEIERYRTQT